MNEIDLERIAARLGDRAAARLDVERTAAAVVSRLRAEQQRRAWWSAGPLLRIAAAVTLIAGAGLIGYQRLGRPAADLPVAPVMASLQALSPDEMEEVLDSLAIEAPTYENVVGLHDLSNEQLAELLHRMEG